MYISIWTFWVYSVHFFCTWWSLAIDLFSNVLFQTFDDSWKYVLTKLLVLLRRHILHQIMVLWNFHSNKFRDTAYNLELLKVYSHKSENVLIYSSLHKYNVPKVSHYNTSYFLRYACPRYIKCLLTNIRKQ